MQRSKACLVALSLFALVLVPSLATAGTFGAEVFGGFNSYSMKDVNDGITATNQGSGTDFSEVSSGLSAGLGLRMWANQNWLLSAAWEPLFANTESSTTITAKQNLNANSFQFTGTYFMPSNTNAKYGFGAGIGYYSIGGEYEVTAPTASTTKIEGSGPGFHVVGTGEWTINKSWAFTGTAGYRVADIEIKDSNPKTTADYSGFIGRVGVVMYFPNSTSK